MSSMIVGGGIADYIFDDAGGLVTFRAAATMTFWDSLTGGSQYTGVSYLDDTAAEGGVVAATSDGRIPAVKADFAGEVSPGGAWVACPAAWTDRRWVAAHEVTTGTGGGGGGGGSTFAVIEVTDHVVLGGLWLKDSDGTLEQSDDAGETWTAIGSGGGGGTYTPPSKLLRVIWHSEGVSAIPADIGTGRVLYVNPASGATAPAWLRSEKDLFATNVTV